MKVFLHIEKVNVIKEKTQNEKYITMDINISFLLFFDIYNFRRCNLPVLKSWIYRNSILLSLFI